MRTSSGRSPKPVRVLSDRQTDRVLSGSSLRAWAASLLLLVDERNQGVIVNYSRNPSRLTVIHDKPSIRTKALSRADFSCPVFLHRVRPELVEDQELRTPRRNQLRWKRIAPSPIDTAATATMIFHANIQPPDRCGSGKRAFRFPRRAAPPSAPVSLDARAPNQFSGLACADHGLSRAALDVGDLRICGVGPQHPVESHG